MLGLGKNAAKLLQKLIEWLTGQISARMRRHWQGDVRLAVFGVGEAVEATAFIPVLWCFAVCGAALCSHFAGIPKDTGAAAPWLWLPACAWAALCWLRVRGVAYGARGITVLGAGVRVEKGWDALRAVRTRRGGKTLEFSDGLVRLYGTAGEDFGLFYAMRRQYAPGAYVDSPATASRKRTRRRGTGFAERVAQRQRDGVCPLCGGAVRRGVCRGCGMRPH